MRTILTLTPLLALLGCAAPKHWSEERPLEPPPQFNQAPKAAASDEEGLLAVFDDDALREIVQLALANNPNLAQAQARLEEQGFNLRQARAALLPNLRAGLSLNESDPPGATQSSLYSAALDTQWEVDVWGRVRAAASAAKSDQAAAAADYEAARQSLAAQATKAWFGLVAAEKLLDLDSRRAASFEASASLIQRRFDLGESTLSELNLARTDYENARADLESSRQQRDVAARLLQSLMGAYPSEALRAQDWPILAENAPTSLPSELLMERPDILASFQRVRAADARAQVAHRELFPSLTLTGRGSRASSSLEALEDASLDAWSLAAGLSAPLFEGGKRRAAKGAAEKRAEQAFQAYRATVINAFREVENALGAERFLAAEEAARLQALDAARAAYRRAQRDYETGLTNLLTYLETQRRVFNTERQTINLRNARLSNRVTLYLALGRGN